ncbi:hypothetical protein AVEN_183927-1 [Araneus ventricosus]|uniref:Uncharacterized protein n=1 Tax=Araneus ventricosus TaxID=182803 RepID=A0A4Y2E3P1_ARAVE|nr:hypothetical protein AVEN_183927-1 [Araneus ventricosus]
MLWFISHLLNQAEALFNNNPSAWEEDFTYKEMKAFIKNLKVVNDRVERGIQLMGEFSQSISKNEYHIQNLLQSVKEYKEKTPCFKKLVLNEI